MSGYLIDIANLCFRGLTTNMRPKNWEPPALQALTASLALIVHLALLAGITTLMILSKSHNGISDVCYNDAFPFSVIGRDGMYKMW